MKNYEVNADSLHYRLASFYADYNDRWHTDVCTYWRKVVRGFFNIIGLLFLLFIAGGSLIHFGLAVIFAIFAGVPFQATWQMLPVLLAIAGVVAIAGTFAVAILVGWVLQTLSTSVRTAVRKAAAKEQPPLMIAAYRSIKEKTCIPVKVVHKSK